MTIKEREKHYWKIVDQHMKALAKLEVLRRQHGLTLEDTCIWPPTNFEDDVELPPELKKMNEFIEMKKSVKKMKESRLTKLDKLPPEVRAAVKKSDELNEFEVELKTDLVCAMRDRFTLKQIAKRLGESVETVKSLAGMSEL